MTYDVTAHLHKFAYITPFCSETVARGRNVSSSIIALEVLFFAVILSPGALRVKCVDGSDGSRAVT